MAENLREEISYVIRNWVEPDSGADTSALKMTDEILALLKQFDSDGLVNYAAGAYSRRNIEAFIEDLTSS